MLLFLHLTPHTMCFQIYTNTTFSVYIFSDPLVKINVTMWDLGHLRPFEPQNILINSVVSAREGGFLNLNKCTVVTTLRLSPQLLNGSGTPCKATLWTALLSDRLRVVLSWALRGSHCTHMLCTLWAGCVTAPVCSSVLISPLFPLSLNFSFQSCSLALGWMIVAIWVFQSAFYCKTLQKPFFWFS